MTNINPPYKHLVQKIHLCGVTCLQMVLFRRNIWLEQEELAQTMGARIRSKSQHLFRLPLKIDDHDAGLNLWEFPNNNSWLEQHHLKAEMFKLSQIDDLKEFITKNLQKGNDLIVNFKRTAYYPEKEWGHYALINSITEDQIELCDPSPQGKPYWKTPLTKLQHAMDNSWDNQERGIIIISEI